MRPGRSLVIALCVLTASLVGCAPCCLKASGVGHADMHTSADIGPHRIEYEARGEGDFAVVLIHGWASNRTFLQEQFDGIEAPRIVGIDLIGHGASDAPDHELATYSFDSMAQSIDSVVKELCIERAVLVGHSNGVPTALAYSRAHPDKVAGLVLIDGTIRQLFTPEMIEGFTAPLKGPDYEDFISQFLDQMVRASGKLTPEQVERLRTGMLATPQHVLIRAISAQAAPGAFSEDPITVPVLMVNAPGPMWTAEYKAYVESKAADLEYIEWTDVSHFLHLERPDEFNSLVSAFVKRVRK